MNILKTKILFYGFLISIIVFFAASSWKFIQAEDDDEGEEEKEKEEGEHDDGDDVSTVIDTDFSSNSSQKTETVTEYRKLSDTVTQVITTITKHDSDGDGMYDDEDPHPTINEYFIVTDNNLNGIDDRYEQSPEPL